MVMGKDFFLLTYSMNDNQLSFLTLSLKDCYFNFCCRNKLNGTNKTQCISNTRNKSKLFGLFILLVQRTM